MRIGIAGMGGIGSFLGAKLAQNFEKNGSAEIVFICRGETKESIEKNGLSLISEGKTINCRPGLVANNPGEIGELDILLVCTKSFSLASVVKEYQDCLKEETLVIPLQNVVNAGEIIRSETGEPIPVVLEACIYVASNIEAPGVVKHVGGPGKVFFGNEDGRDFKWVEDLLREGGIDAVYTKNIKHILWKKYLFVSPVAAMTTALDISFGELAENPHHMERLQKLMKEVQAVAEKQNIQLTKDDVADSLGMLSNFPYQAKSSLQLDFEKKAVKTEKAYLVDFIVEQGNYLGVEVEGYREMQQKME